MNFYNNNDERREFPRIDLKILDLSFAAFGKVDRSKEIFPKDIGLGGISFSTDAVLKPGDLINLTIALPTRSSSEKVVAQVVWAHLSSHSSVGGRVLYDVGVSFVSINKELISEIINLLNEN